jgi:hypothetical protein
MGQATASGKPPDSLAIKFKVGHIDITREQPKNSCVIARAIAQQRQRPCNATGGFKRAAKVFALMGVRQW